jgi:hypothetical protein
MKVAFFKKKTGWELLAPIAVSCNFLVLEGGILGGIADL